MVPEPTKPSHSSSSDGDKHKQLDREVRDMVNAITSRVGDLHKTGGSQQAEQDENGVRIITLAGTNTGATMRTELDEKVPNNAPQGGVSAGEPDLLDTYVNSNFQAVNNSIMLGSSYNTNDPGVHLDISDVFDHRGHKPNKHAKKGKKKDKEALKSDQQTERSD
ncbi:hypothetical protein P3X46_035120 [Hevea brasiliensis]|uniref:Uncharacterized protein n=1 Tax=Hevea brasiliensis TaxID=3981 RepID=A0ABQ9KBC2_HEVBR|nr:uncharacterized protein LOC110661978 [Hevea brasiliensis]KAJ9131464.1 hypothetical protein P3X46_035120 [Hevea brasiliensis]